MQGSLVSCQAQAGFAAFGKGVNLISSPPPPILKLLPKRYYAELESLHVV